MEGTGHAALPTGLDRVNALWLLALALLLVFVALQPLLTFPVFGSDTGEYYRLTLTLVTTGHVAPGTSYPGWGSAYNDFPGIFFVAGATAQGAGVNVLSALIYSIPVIAVLSVLPLFLLFRRIFRQDTIAILGAGFASVAFPRIFSIAHPAPLALGDFFVVAALWMFVEGRQDARWYLPLSLTSGALIVTHHLSSFFFLLSALGTLVLYELIRPGGWARRFPFRELAFLGGFVTVLWVYWLGYAVAFRPIVFAALPPSAAGWAEAHIGPVVGAVVAASLLVIVFLGALLRWRRQTGELRPPHVKFPADRSYVLELIAFCLALFLGLSIFLFVPVPGTSETASTGTLLFVAPLLLAIVFVAGTRRLLTLSRLGPLVPTWIGALALGVAVASIVALALPSAQASADPLTPGRFAEYLVIPLGLMIAVGLGRLVARAGDVGGRRAVVAASLAVVILLGANAASAYPPPAVFGGFQEGLTPQDATLWLWVGIGIPVTAVVASDHRLSSMIFGIDGNRATWDSTPALFTGDNRSAAFAELNSSFAPHVLLPINAVVVDTVMYSGVALDPGALAEPLSPAALLWLSEPPFVPVYENGLAVVYWVAAVP
ncbi:MAG: hypothetical protein WCA77_03805 [Thermoplasmata archaeon]